MPSLLLLPLKAYLRCGVLPQVNCDHPNKDPDSILYRRGPDNEMIIE